METFGTRLRAAMDTRGPLCVGIDPHASLLRDWGLDDDPAGLERFAMTVRRGAGEPRSRSSSRSRPSSSGTARAASPYWRRPSRAAREAGALVLLDAKRGDIGSTMQGYADAYLDQTSPLAVDAMTVSPYLGFESLRPMLDTAAAHGAGVFVLGLTSNPEGAQVQHARNGDVLVAQEILDAIAKENSGQAPMGSVGAVVGANLPSLGCRRRDQRPDPGARLRRPGRHRRQPAPAVRLEVLRSVHLARRPRRDVPCGQGLRARARRGAAASACGTDPRARCAYAPGCGRIRAPDVLEGISW